MYKPSLSTKINYRYRLRLLTGDGGGADPVNLPDLAGLTPTAESNYTGIASSPDGGFVSPDGLTAHALDTTAPYNINRFDLTPAYDVSSASYVEDAANAFSVNERHPFYTPAGYIFTIDTVSGNIRRYDLDDAEDPLSYPAAAAQSEATGLGNPRTVWFTNGGTDVYVVNDTDDKVYWAELSTAWDLTSLSAFTASTNTVLGSTRGFVMSDDGTRCYAILNAILRQHELSTPYDISTMGTYAVQHTLPGVSGGCRQAMYVDDKLFTADGSRFRFTSFL